MNYTESMTDVCYNFYIMQIPMQQVCWVCVLLYMYVQYMCTYVSTIKMHQRICMVRDDNQLL